MHLKKPSQKRRERRKPILIVQHAQHEQPAAIRRAIESQGIQTLWIHPYQGEVYPDLSEIKGMISLGGPMGANDEDLYPWIKDECRLLRKCIESNRPVVGICLGAQMIAKALGGHVKKNKTAEIGWFPIHLNQAGKNDPITGAAGNNPTVYHWHCDTFYLPLEATLLAHSRSCDRQAFHIGEKAYGFQFHPEADHQLIHEWLAIDGVEEEIKQMQEIHGEATVQNAEYQRALALEGERASLKITAAIGQLFKNKTFESVSPQLHKQFQRWARNKSKLIIEFESSQRKAVQLKGQIAILLNIPHGDFVIFREENSILWPIRMDNILAAHSEQF